MASISYRPVTVEEEVRSAMDRLNWHMRRFARDMATEANKDAPPGKEVAAPVPPQVEIRNFKKLSGDSGKPWEGTYQFQYVVVFDKPQDAAVFREKKYLKPEDVRTTLTSSVRFLDASKTEAVEADAEDPRQIVYLVTTATTTQDLASWPHEPALFFGLVPLRFMHVPPAAVVNIIMSGIVNKFGAGIAMLISTIITAFFIPNMLRKGTIDMLLVKPIHRTTLLLYKFVGGLTFMFLNTVVIVLGIYLVIGLRSGLWVHGFLISIFVLTF